MKTILAIVFAIFVCAATVDAAPCNSGQCPPQVRQFRTPVRSYFYRHQPVRSTFRAWFVPMDQRPR